MTREQYEKASASFKEIDKLSESLRNIMKAHEIIKSGKVDKLILIGKQADLTPVEIHIEIPADILHDAIDSTWNKLGAEIENIKDLIKEL